MATSATARRSASRPRVSKDPAVRREELLDHALALCRTDGFEAMSVEQLTRAAGVAKGTFYHYFTSKDDLLEQLTQRFGDALFDQLSAASAEGDAAQRLTALMSASAAFKLENAEVSYASFLYREENFALRHRIFARWRERAREVLQPIIRDGRSDGSLQVVDVATTTDVVLLLWFDAADHLWSRAIKASDEAAFVETMLGGAAAIFSAQSRVLGIEEPGFGVRAEPEVISLLCQLYASLDRNQP